MMETMSHKSFGSRLLEFVFISTIILRTFVSFQFLGEENIVMRLLSIVCAMGCLYYVALLLLRKAAFSFISLSLLVIFVYYAFISIVNERYLVSLLGRAMDIFVLWGYFENNRDDFYSAMRNIMYVSAACVFINFVLVLLFPEGLWESKMEVGNKMFYFLGGNYNSFGPRMLCSILVILTCCQYRKRYYLLFFLLFVASVVSVLLTGSKTSLVGISLLFIYFLFLGRKPRKIIFLLSVFAVLLFETLIVFLDFNIGEIEIAKHFIEDILQKDTDFTYRTELWRRALVCISEHPIFGYGYVDNDWWSHNISVYARGPHNFVLCELIYGGIVGLLMWTCLTCAIIRKTVSSSFKYVLCIGLSCLLLMMCFEVYGAFYLVFILFLIYYYSLQNNDADAQS